MTNQFSITIELAGKTFKGKGDTVADALVSIPKPEKIMAKGVLTVKNGALKRELVMYPSRLKRLFYNKNFQIIQAKWLGQGLK